MTTPPVVVCIVGPTASGKSAVALAVASRLPIEIVSADSRQVYRGLDVGTAKPTPEERARVPHHGIDVVPPTAAYDAAQFAAMARAAVGEIHARGRHALIVGGTGLYLRALLRGLCAAPPRHPALRDVLTHLVRREGSPLWHARLAHVDPVLAERVHPRDAVRIIRGLEVALGTGRRLSAWQAAGGTPAPWPVRLLGLEVPVPLLDDRIARRTAQMLDAGWLDEVQRLVATLAPTAPAWRTVGYRELRTHVEGRSTLADATAAIVRATRQFAKRQRTWFRAEPAIAWRRPDDRDALVDEVVAALRGDAAALAPGRAREAS